MKRYWILFGIIFFMFSLSGCITVRKVVRERVDQGIDGNKGYLAGIPDTAPRAMPVDREYIDIRVEMPTWGEVTAPAVRHENDTQATSKASKGNKGYVSGREQPKEKKPYISQKAPKTATAYEYDDYEIDVYDDKGDAFVYEERAVKPAYQEYTVKQGDTLSHIAKAFYNKASKWTIIYEANSDKIKDPSRVKAGTKLRIPDLRDAEFKYIK